MRFRRDYFFEFAVLLGVNLRSFADSSSISAVTPARTWAGAPPPPPR